jgi:hypothetical protein
VGAEREWWRRVVLVLARPGEVFTALRDDSDESAADRQDVVVALAFAAGVAAALVAVAFEDVGVTAKVIGILASGLAIGFTGYWLFGWALGFVVPRLGAGGSRRRVRHILAFALGPLVLAVPLWLVWPWLLIPLAAWSLGLLIVGLRVVYRWSYARSAIAVGLTAVWLGALAVALLSVLALLGRGLE